MINWNTDEPTEFNDSIVLYNDESEEEDFDCTSELLIKHDDSMSVGITFSKGFYVRDKQEWYDAEGGEIFCVYGWYDLIAELNNQRDQ